MSRSLSMTAALLGLAMAAPLSAADGERPKVPEIAEPLQGAVTVNPEQLPLPVLETLVANIDRGEIVWRLYREQVGDDTAWSALVGNELLVIGPDGDVRGRREVPSRPALQDGVAAVPGTGSITNLRDAPVEDGAQARRPDDARQGEPGARRGGEPRPDDTRQD